MKRFLQSGIFYSLHFLLSFLSQDMNGLQQVLQTITLPGTRGGVNKKITRRTTGARGCYFLTSVYRATYSNVQTNLINV